MIVGSGKWPAVVSATQPGIQLFEAVQGQRATDKGEDHKNDESCRIHSNEE
jgi:hypothetical protein